MSTKVPEISKEFICIIDSANKELAACISSYISKQGYYYPFFEFQQVLVSKKDQDLNKLEIYEITHARAQQFIILAENVINRLDGCQNLIFVGLSAEQRSYLSSFDRYGPIEINSYDDITFLLGSFFPQKETEFICRPDQVSLGLFEAVKAGCRLKIDPYAKFLEIVNIPSEGLIVIEDDPYVSSIIGVNYAIATGSNIFLCIPITEGEVERVYELLENCREGKTQECIILELLINSRISEIDFSKYSFSTFFTNGLPYSLTIKCKIICTYVNLLWAPDFFIFNNLYWESKPQLGPSIVFSPGFFEVEETKYVALQLENLNYDVERINGEQCSVTNLDMLLALYPYDFFHICSHGGEVEGHLVTEKFEDRFGDEHVVQYESILSISPSAQRGLFRVEEIQFYRKFNDLIWKSNELREKAYRKETFIDMRMHCLEAKKKQKPIDIEAVKIITNSRSIKCDDGYYFGGHYQFASSRTSPIIFNNSCWSAFRIAGDFIEGGARGYIGTLWKIDNDLASDTACQFYSNLNKHTVASSLKIAQINLIGSKAENIYIYWGLHFTTFKKLAKDYSSKEKIISILSNIRRQWMFEYPRANSRPVQENIRMRIEWIFTKINEILKDYR